MRVNQSNRDDFDPQVSFSELPHRIDTKRLHDVIDTNLMTTRMNERAAF